MRSKMDSTPYLLDFDPRKFPDGLSDYWSYAGQKASYVNFQVILQGH